MFQKVTIFWEFPRNFLRKTVHFFNHKIPKNRKKFSFLLSDLEIDEEEEDETDKKIQNFAKTTTTGEKEQKTEKTPKIATKRHTIGGSIGEKTDMIGNFGRPVPHTHVVQTPEVSCGKFIFVGIF